jgi:hypothetical protein
VLSLVLWAGYATPVDVVARTEELPFPDGAFDFVLASHVAENLPEPDQVSSAPPPRHAGRLARTIAITLMTLVDDVQVGRRVRREGPIRGHDCGR